MRYSRMLATLLAAVTLGLVTAAAPALAATTNGPGYCCSE